MYWLIDSFIHLWISFLVWSKPEFFVRTLFYMMCFFVRVDFEYHCCSRSPVCARCIHSNHLFGVCFTWWPSIRSHMKDPVIRGTCLSIYRLWWMDGDDSFILPRCRLVDWLIHTYMYTYIRAGHPLFSPSYLVIGFDGVPITRKLDRVKVRTRAVWLLNNSVFGRILFDSILVVCVRIHYNPDSIPLFAHHNTLGFLNISK